jgi:glutathione reductase (NADPH)
MRTAFIGRSSRALMKLIVRAESRRVLGCHIVAPNAGEMIQRVSIAVKLGANHGDFDRTVAVHPTLAEELVTMATPTRRS